MSQRFIDPSVSTTFRLAEVSDIPAMAPLFRKFFEESELAAAGLEYFEDGLRQSLAWKIQTGTTPHIIAIDENGQVVGSIAYLLHSEFTTRPIAVIDKFYVLPTRRRSAIGRVLLALATESAKADGAAVMRIFINSGIAGSGNIFRRMGFAEVPHSGLFGKEL